MLIHWLSVEMEMCEGRVIRRIKKRKTENGKRTKLTRPLQKLIPLEVNSRTENTCSNEDINIINDTDVSNLRNNAFDCAGEQKEDKRITNPEESAIE